MVVGHNLNTCENEGNLQTFVDHKKTRGNNNTEDELKISSDESIENNSEEDQEDYEWDSDSHSSEDPTNNLVTYGRYTYYVLLSG